MDFATMIKNYRLDHRLTQTALAEILAVDRTTVIKWEKGTLPRYDRLKSVCDKLGATCDVMDSDGTRLDALTNAEKMVLSDAIDHEIKRLNEIIEFESNRRHSNDNIIDCAKQTINILTGIDAKLWGG